MKQWVLVLLWLSGLHAGSLSGQCNNSEEFPAGGAVVSTFNDTVIVTTEQHAGQYFVALGFQAGETYVVGSTSSEDYFTILDEDDLSMVIAEGINPLIYSPGASTVIVEVNLASPPCGTDTLDRTTYLVCTSCPAPPPPPAPPPAVGVGVTAPEAFLDVAGEIRLGDAQWPAQAGMIRWNPDREDFEGYDGFRWKSLSRPNGSWGYLPNPVVNENDQVMAGDGESFDLFGSSVAISGDYAVVGAPQDSIAGIYVGSAYVFKRSGSSWVQEAKLTASDGANGDDFGNSVGISGDYVVVGAIEDNIGSNASQGSAYVFQRSGTSWSQMAKLTASDGAGGDKFGSSVSISGDQIIVGAYYDDVGANVDQGSAYVFKRSGTAWTQEAKLTAYNGAAEDLFGLSVSISGDYAIVGAPYDDFIANSDQGTAYVFKRTGTSWTHEWYIAASDGSAGNNFGVSVSISGDYAIVGSPLSNNSLQGSAYVFKRNGTTWPQEAKLVAQDGEPNDYFGSSVCLTSDFAIVGTPTDDTGSNTSQGGAWIFKRSGTSWTQEAKLLASDGKPFSWFGFGVAISDAFVVSGANGAGVMEGAVYFFNRNQ